MKALDDKFGLLFVAKPNHNGQFLIRPTNEKSLRILSEVREINSRRLHITVLPSGVWALSPDQSGCNLHSGAAQVPVGDRDQTGLCVL